MAVILNTKLLVESPPLQQIFNDFNTGIAAVGTLRFFEDTARTIPKAVYVRSATPGQFDAVIEFPLDNAGAVPSLFFFFPVDETDNTIPQAYFLEVKNQSDIVIFIREDFPPSEDGGGITPVEASNVRNLAPDFGFESPILPTTFNLIDNVAINSLDLSSGNLGFIISTGWEYDIENTANSKDVYEFETLNTSTFEGNPQNEIIIESTDNSGPTTFKRFGFRLGNPNDFKGIQLVYSVLWRWIGVLAASEIDITLVVNPRGVGEEIHFLAKLPITLTQARQTIDFTIPASFGVTIPRDAPSYIVFDFPVATNFKIGITGTWLQVGSVATGVTISEDSQGQKEAHLSGSTENEVGFASEGYEKQRLPLAWELGKIEPLTTTGSVEKRAHFAEISNFSVPFSGTDYYNTDIISTTKTSPKRFQKIIHGSPQVNGHTIFHSNLLANVVEFFVKGGDLFVSGWIQNTATTITFAEIGVGNLPYEISGVQMGPTELRLTYIPTAPANIGGGTDATWGYFGGTFPNAGFPINTSTSIRSWYYPQDPTNPNLPFFTYGNGSLEAVQISNSPVTIDLDFVSNDPLDYLPVKTVFEEHNRSTRAVWNASNIYSNFISWNLVQDINRTQSPYFVRSFFDGKIIQSNLSEASVHLGFKNNSTNLHNIRPGFRHTLYADIEGAGNRGDVMDAFLLAIAAVSTHWKLTVNALPANGAFFTFTNSVDVFAGLFHRSTDAFPTDPPGTFKKILVIKFDPSISTTDLTKIIADTITNWIIYVPTSAEANLSIATGEENHLTV